MFYILYGIRPNFKHFTSLAVMCIYEAGHEKRYQVLVSSYGDNRQNVKVTGKTEIGLGKIKWDQMLINLCM